MVGLLAQVPAFQIVSSRGVPNPDDPTSTVVVEKLRHPATESMLMQLVLLEEAYANYQASGRAINAVLARAQATHVRMQQACPFDLRHWNA